MKISMSSKDEGGASASERIDAQIRELDDWRGKTLASLRKTSSTPTRKSSRSGSGWAARYGHATA